MANTTNEKYWRERCEAAEAVIESYSEWDKAFDFEKHSKWKQLKSTPIPILTPCVELEKEVERLKGLIEKAYRLGFDSGMKTKVSDHNKILEQFKTENNL